MKKKILVFGMDGNVLDNYSIKASCAGKAMQKNAQSSLEIYKEVKFYSDIYLETSGMNSLKQFNIAYERITSKDKITNQILQSTEIDFRRFLREEDKKTKMFDDVKRFLETNKGKFVFTITTTVPISKIQELAQITKLDQYMNMICARDGVWIDGSIMEFSDFDKGPQHYDYILEYFNIKKEDLIAVSSTKADINNALEFGISSIAVEHIFDEKELKKLNPDYIVKDFINLNKILDS